MNFCQDWPDEQVFLRWIALRFPPRNGHRARVARVSLFFLVVMLSAGCATQRPSARAWPRHRLAADQITLLTPPNRDRFDASALLLTPSGDLLTLRDNSGPLLYRIELLPGGGEARLVALGDCFTTPQVAALGRGGVDQELDCEGIAQDEQGRFYVCEERRRWILRCDPKTGQTERLPIDWSPVKDFFSPLDSNASFEGVAVGKGRLYVANERSSPVIIVVDLASLRVTGHFVVYPKTSSLLGTHYSDLCWFEDRLWVLCRQHRAVLEVNPETHAVLAEFDYSDLERELGYRIGLPLGIMEGLAVSRDTIWLATDNNGADRARARGDIRPTLVRCPRPDRR